MLSYLKYDFSTVFYFCMLDSNSATEVGLNDRITKRLYFSVACRNWVKPLAVVYYRIGNQLGVVFSAF